MHVIQLCSIALLVIASSAKAQDQGEPVSADCHLLEPATFEETILGCEEEARVAREWLERHRIGEAVDPAEVELLDEEQTPELPPLAQGQRYAEIDGMVVALDPESYELLQLIRRAARVPREEASRAEGEAREEPRERDQGDRPRDREDQVRREDQDRDGASQAFDIPNGHRPPPGSCRVWFPDRPPGHQPPPGPCNIEVPEGAVLIRG